MTQLESVTLPEYYLTRAVLRVLEGLHSLYAVTKTPDVETKYNEDALQLHVTLGSLQNLDTFHFDAHLPKAAACIKGSPMHRLKSLEVHCPRLSHAADLEDLCAAAAGSCQELQDVLIILFPDPDQQDQLVTFDCLRPLLGCRSLRRLEILDQSHITLEEADAVMMGRAWSGLETLVLSPWVRFDYVSEVNPGVSCSTVVAIVEAFPQLKYLGVYLDERPPHFQLQSKHSSSAPLSSNRLELNVGLSKVPGGDARQTASLLAARSDRLFISEECFQALGTDDRDEDPFQWASDWRTVADYLKEIAIARKDGLHSGRHMQDEGMQG